MWVCGVAANAGAVEFEDAKEGLARERMVECVLDLREWSGSDGGGGGRRRGDMGRCGAGR